MNKLFALLIFGMGTGLSAQETPGQPALPQPSPVSGKKQEAPMPAPIPNPKRGVMRGLQKSAVSMRLLARILSNDNTELWTNGYDKITIPGRPVSIKLLGNNVIVLVQFTPYLRGESWVLVAQGQVWLQNESQGLRYETTLQTIPVKFGESVYYFPLGAKDSNGGDYIEIKIELQPYIHDETSMENPKEYYKE
ncbi:MAG: hypothetical protein LBG79_07435 [Spirochaetaceae bacterium]|jgi:hypothetical protein|nr:hypothetical protein [Spirochaetaceae bacterium]